MLASRESNWSISAFPDSVKSSGPPCPGLLSKCRRHPSLSGDRSTSAANSDRRLFRSELVNFCVSGFGQIERPAVPRLAVEMPPPPEPQRRPVYFGGEFRPTPVYQRSTLPPGFRLDGPAVIEEFGSTTVVFPGQHLEVDAHGILVVRRATMTSGSLQ